MGALGGKHHAATSAMAIGSILTAFFGSFVLAEEPPADPVKYRVEEVVSGFAYPWSMAFLPSGNLLITERDGGLQRFTWNTLSFTPIEGLPDDIFVRGQGGLFDVVLAPDFATSRLVYLSYAQGTRRANTTRVARARLQGKQLSNFEVIFTSSPTKDTPAHFGGRMAFLPDGTLLLTLGDGFVYREKAQDVGSHLGKIVRIGPDGSVPADNPFVGTPGALPEIWTLGHRNVQGILVEPDTGRVYAHEHGARGGDEINLIEPGTNYGWPVITYSIDYNGAIISPYTEREGYGTAASSVDPLDRALRHDALFGRAVSQMGRGPLGLGACSRARGAHRSRKWRNRRAYIPF